ncbi:hypothetical protein EB796_006755 [Bugula neritina]|uniref:G-protein coupled receptors family 1 profile domain-containing protein n=1 Tax=Bugula neritina TaxID=10212 RepID=A0A7J7K8H4_BUGNE|nr:hypothetical protein EB796_006755 [Bugula neritina]
MSRYTEEGRVSCSLDWFNPSPGYKAFNLTMLVTVFFIPGLIMLTTNIIIFKVVSGSTIKKKDKTLLAREIELAKKMVYSKVFYLLAWAPYGIVSVWATVDWQTLPSYLLTSTGFFAKVSFTLNPLLYVGMNKKYRTEMYAMLFPWRPVDTPAAREDTPTSYSMEISKVSEDQTQSQSNHQIKEEREESELSTCDQKE